MSTSRMSPIRLTNFFNTTGGIPLVFGALTPAGLTQVSGEVADRHAANHVRRDDAVHGSDDRSVYRWPRRAAMLRHQAGAASGYAATQSAGAARDAYAMSNEAPVTTFDAALERVGGGLRRFADHRRQCDAGIEYDDQSSIYGTAVGADYRISPFTVAGFALAGGGTNFCVANSGSGRSDLFQAGAFIRHTVGPAYISAALAYGWQDITTDRTVTVAGVDQLQAKFNGNAFSGRLEGGYRFVTPWMGGLTPYAAAQFTAFDLPAYAEQAIVGSNIFALAYSAKDVTDTRSELGLRTDNSFALPDCDAHAARPLGLGA